MNASANGSTESDFRKILARKILQLDGLYSTSNDLKLKAQILSQMIRLIGEIDPNVLDEEVEVEVYYEKRKKRLYDIAYDIISDVIKEEGYRRYSNATALSWLDFVRAKILSYLAKEKLITVDDFEEEKNKS